MFQFEENYQNDFVSYNRQSKSSSKNEVDVVLLFIPKYEKEIVQNVRVETTESGDIELNSLVNSLQKLNYPVESSMIFYYSQTTGMYIYCGNDPVPVDMVIPQSEIAYERGRKVVTIRVRQIEQSDFPKVECDYELETAALIDFNIDTCFDLDSDDKNRRRRHKERKVSEVLDLVLKWRKLYSGVRDPRTGQIMKFSLDEAAQKVGVAKKSLDDYLLQIRFARRFGFNFQQHSEEKIGMLRAFVKKEKTLKKEIKCDDMSVDSEETAHFSELQNNKSKKISKKAI